jgi:GNAT superfamily N-acetyltransferase
MIRPARPEDVPTIASLIRQLARYERLEHEVALTEGDLSAHLFGAPQSACSSAAKERTKNWGNVEVLLAEDAGTVVGFALFFPNYSTFLGRPGLYLEDLFILPEHRRRGWGRALLVAVARIAVERGCGRFEWAALQWNEPAIEFYRALGAQRMDEWRTFRVTGEALGKLASGGDDA